MSKSYGTGGFGGGATLWLIDFRILPRSLFVEITALGTIAGWLSYFTAAPAIPAWPAR